VQNDVKNAWPRKGNFRGGGETRKGMNKTRKKRVVRGWGEENQERISYRKKLSWCGYFTISIEGAGKGKGESERVGEI